MPTNNGNSLSLKKFVETCSFFEFLVLDSDVTNFCLLGDMNCKPESGFFPILN